MHDACAFCETIFEPSEFQHWVSSEGETVVVPSSDRIYVLAELDRGETCICEACYRARAFLPASDEELLDVHYQFGLTYNDAGDQRSAVQAFKAALAIRETADILAGLARSHGELGEPEEEIGLLRRAVALQPGHFAECNLTVALARGGHLDEAMTRIDQALSAEPRDANLWMLKAEVAHRRGATQEAQAAYREARARSHCETCRREYDERWRQITEPSPKDPPN